MKAPCLSCDRRGCGKYHDFCGKYKEYRDTREKIRIERKKAYASRPPSRRHWPTAETNSILKSPKK